MKNQNLLHFKLIFLAISILISQNITAQTTIHSTTSGGNWEDGSTWVGDTVPNANNNVILNGPVSLISNQTCNDLRIEPAGIIQTTYNKTLTVNGDIENYGTVRNGGGVLNLSLKGNVVNDGIWTNNQTHLNGDTEQILSCYNQNVFECSQFISFNSSNQIIAEANIYFENTYVDFNSDTLYILKGNTISIKGEHIRDINIKGDSSYLYMHNGAYINGSNLTDIILRGIVQIGDNHVRFYGNLVLLDTLQNYGTGHYCQIIGNIINNGVIRNGNNDLEVRITGDLTNNFIWKNIRTLLNGTTSQYLFFAPDVVFTGYQFKVSNDSSIIATTDLVFDNTIIELEDTLIMQPKNKLSVTGVDNYLRWGVITGNNYELEMNGGCYLQNIKIHDVSLKGNVKINGNITLSGNIYVQDTLENEGSDHTLYVNGNLTNNGIIQNGENDLRIHISNDLFNNEEMTNTEIIFNGNVDQNIRLIDDAPIFSQIKVESNISGPGWHWYLNDIQISGATAPSLTLNNLSSSDYGIYYCISYSGTSRNFIVQTDTKPNFSADKTEACTSETITFTDETSTPFSIVSYLWDFGDGYTSDQQNPIHIYKTSGLHPVSLTVFDGYHEYSLVKDDYILINQSPSPDFDFLNVNLGEEAVFTDLSQNVAQIINYETQWADIVFNFSSRWTALPPDPSWWWSEQQILGEPDVYPLYGDFVEAWAPLTANAQREFIEVGFETARRINRISIYETLKPGSIDTVYIKNNLGEWIEIWSGTAHPMPDEAREFIIDFPITDFEVSAVRIAMNTEAVPYWNELDAVSITSPVDTIYHPEVTYLWDVGENGTTYNTIGDISHLYGAPGIYDVSLTITNPASCENFIAKTIMVIDTPNISLDMKAFLEGPFNVTAMNTELYSFIPENQPYSDQPWNYTGNEKALTIPDDVVDWILIELRETPYIADSATSSTIICRQAGFILNDGSITALDGKSFLKFSVNISQNLFAVIRHRNHLDIMSANQLTEVSGKYSYDFSTSSSQVYGSIEGYKELAPGIWGLAGGDGNANGLINSSDKIDFWLIQAGLCGYKAADFNLNVQVSNNDKNDIWAPNLGKNSKVPE